MSASPSLQELFAAGYQYGQVIACPYNDLRGQCPCQYAGPQKDCGMTEEAPMPLARLTE